MLEFLIVVAVFAIITLVIYSPAIVQYFLWKKSEKKFQIELHALENSGLYDQCRIVITEPLGVGTEPVGKISFADAHKNQEFAMNSIMKMMG